MKWNENIRALREDSDLTQTQMAQICSISQNAISKYELAERQLPIETLIKYCKFFNVSADYILGLSDKRQVNK